MKRDLSKVKTNLFSERFEQSVALTTQELQQLLFFLTTPFLAAHKYWNKNIITNQVLLWYLR